MKRKPKKPDPFRGTNDLSCVLFYMSLDAKEEHDGETDRDRDRKNVRR